MSVTSIIKIYHEMETPVMSTIHDLYDLVWEKLWEDIELDE